MTSASISTDSNSRQVYHVSCGGVGSSIKWCVERAKQICDGARIVSTIQQPLKQNNKDVGSPTELYISCVVEPPPVSPIDNQEDRVVATESLSDGTHFDFDKATLTKTGEGVLSALIKRISNYEIKKISIDGHTDSIGTAKYNDSLSKRRAETVRSYLEINGIKSDNWDIRWFGKSKPAFSNDTPENRAKNRRVEIVVTGVKRLQDNDEASKNTSE